jgi:hydroxymethylbilane synthase
MAEALAGARSGAGAPWVLRIATRGSAQARTQAEAVGAALVAAHPDCVVEYVLVETSGDQRPDVALHHLGGQGVFVKEVQHAVLDGRADLAVHSAKDLPSLPTPGLVLAAFTARRDPRDVLVGRPLGDLPHGATVATGSVRRRAQLARLRPDLQFVELRGNIHTRLSRVPDGGAIVMAAAALQILGLGDRAAQVMTPDEMCPQVGQGTVVVECRAGDADALARLAAVDDADTRLAVTTERAFLARLGTGCSLPVAAHATLSGDGPARALELRTFLSGPEGVHADSVASAAGGDTLAFAEAEAERARSAVGW